MLILVKHFRKVASGCRGHEDISVVGGMSFILNDMLHRNGRSRFPGRDVGRLSEGILCELCSAFELESWRSACLGGALIEVDRSWGWLLYLEV